MPNHASLYVIHEKVVITGDAASVQQGVIQTVSPQFTLNMDDAKKSLDFILSLDAERYFCFHGGLYFKK
jgi:glyoxylase-like metal-dependent hydrolase (beta-lactamase superfamily II)